MVEASLTDATCRQESQVDSERANKRFRVGWPPAADLAQKGRSYRGGGVLAGVSTERRKHLLQQVLVAINGYLRQSPMLQEPFAEGDQRGWSLRNCVWVRPDDTLLTEIPDEPFDSCHIGAGNAWVTAAPRTFAAMCSKRLDDLFIDSRQAQTSSLQPPAEMDHRVQIAADG